ncbi:hypothetical protein [Glycomyces sp. NPDC021274]|uniref:hypothetical protein n=1 Tax=Glycomyces sp. NPDC021274 TaxID=3155120 RepID=UPI0033EA72D5
MKASESATTYPGMVGAPARETDVDSYPALSPEVERRIVAMMRLELPKAAERLAAREKAKAAEHVKAA